MPSRRPSSPILFTAIAATAVMLPWAIYGLPGERSDTPTPDQTTALVEQPLVDLPAGDSVREVSQPTPFSMIALTGADLTGTSARVRAKRDDGSWGPWYDVENAESHATDETSTAGPRGTEPVFVGDTTAVQIAITRPEVPPAPPQPKPDDSLGYRPVNVAQPLGQNLTAVLITPPKAPANLGLPLPTAAITPGMPPNVISRAQWGADESMRCAPPRYDERVRAAVVHHTAGNNDYGPQDSANIVRAIYAYHTRTLGWCDIAYHSLVDKYGQVFEGRFGGMDRPVEGSHTGGFNLDTWSVAMIGTFDVTPPPPIQLRTVGRLLGWRLSLDHVDPLGTVVLRSAGGSFTHFALGSTPTLPTIFTHRDVGITDCPGNAAYAAMPRIRDIAARFNEPPGPEELAESLEGGAIHARWQQMGAMTGPLGAPTSPEAAGQDATRYVRFERGAMYWSPGTGAAPVTGAIYEAWASLGFERGALGLPTSAEIQEPQWIVQNFQHGTLNFDRESGRVTRVLDGIAELLPPPNTNGMPVQMERFTPPANVP